MQGASPNEVNMGEEGVSGIVLCGYLYKVLSDSNMQFLRRQQPTVSQHVPELTVVFDSRAPLWLENGIGVGSPLPKGASVSSKSAW